MSSFTAAKDCLLSYVPRIPQGMASGACALASASISYDIFVLSKDCVLKGSALAAQMVAQKALESAPRAVQFACIASQCMPQYRHFATMAIALSCTALLTYKYGREFLFGFSPSAPSLPPPRK